jgi:methanogenic corrinoid protein MtbC1
LPGSCQEGMRQVGQRYAERKYYLSGLITSAYDSMRDTVSLLHADGFQVPIIIGGSQIDEDVCRYTSADYWVTDANEGLKLCKQLLAKSTRSGVE